MVLADGEGFGAGAHVTTEMALAEIFRLEHGTALDVGCGAGLLSLAWALLGKGRVRGIDVDTRAVAQARRSAHLNPGVEIEFAIAEIGRLRHDLDVDVLLANLPRPGHDALLGHDLRPRALLVTGMGRRDTDEVCEAWRARDLRTHAASRRGRWHLRVLKAEAAPE